MPAAPFPVIGTVAPLVTGFVLWIATGSTFALVGAVIAPTMVLAHFLDARRRSRAAERERVASTAREDAIRREVERRKARESVAAANRHRPSVADIASSPDWVPALSGDTTVRVGSLADGSPWLESLAQGLAVAGEGNAADSVWLSALVHGRAQLGEPSGDDSDWSWPDGSRLVRGSAPDVARTIRCAGRRVESVTNRGGLPHAGEWRTDDMSGARAVLAKLRTPNPPLRFADRGRCVRGIGLSVNTPLVLDLTSDTPHILVAGRTGSGKSLALSALVLDWAERFTTAELTFVGVDFKGGATFRRLERVPHLAAVVTDLDEVVPRMLAGIAAEMRRREHIFNAQHVSRIEDATGVPRLVLMIDEAHEFLRRHPEAHELLADIARRGRSLGVHLVVAIQQPAALRDSVLANIPVRIALAGNTTHDVGAVLGRSVPTIPPRGRALVTLGDGVIRELELRVVDDPDVWGIPGGPRPAPPWCAPLGWPLPRGIRQGFGILDDTVAARQRSAVWTPSDGDVVVVGARGSGKTTALRRLVEGLPVSWVRAPVDLDESETDIVVVDDLDRVLSRQSPRDAADLLERLGRLRSEETRRTFLYSVAGFSPRVTGTTPNVLTLRLPTIDEHRATGADTATWVKSTPPGTGVWNGIPVVIYASTDSIDTESIP